MERFEGRIGIILIGLAGVAALVSLCVWQLQRLEWKEGIIAVLEERMAAAPAPLPAAFDPETQEFSRVRLSGAFPGEPGAHGFVDAPLLVSLRPHGPGYRVIQPFETSGGRRVMVDRGYAPVTEKNEAGAAARATPAPAGPIEVVGALRWPEEGGEGDPFGASDNVWTARDLEVMARLFSAEPVLVVAETSTAPDGAKWPIPQPLEAVKIKNDHLEYALTWAALAIAWAAMTGWLAFKPRGEA